jgi:glycosyltransferase involved in cell wall biosynthesis
MISSCQDEVPFVSVIIPAFNRFLYLEELINSIHQHADFPFELIVHDDNSTKEGTKEAIATLSNKISATIFSHGFNLGLAESINRAVRLASSNYIIMLNADIQVEKPFFKDTYQTLQNIYVGYLTFMSVYKDIPLGINQDGTSFMFTRGLGSGCAIAFRKDTWDQVNGWNNKTVATGNADVSFMIRIVKQGFFPAALIHSTLDPIVRNISNEKANNIDSTIGRQPWDCSLPRLFNYSNYMKESLKRYGAAADAMQISYKEEAGETNLDYFHKFLNRLIKENYTIDWEEAAHFGHNRWEGMIHLEPPKPIAEPQPTEREFLNIVTPETTRNLVRKIFLQVYTTQNADELIWVMEKIKLLNPTAILEIGVDSGGSLKAWEQTLKQNKDSILIGIDENPNVEWNYLESNVSVHIIQGNSHDPKVLQEVERILKDRKLDFIFIDAQHTPAAARQDTETYQPLLKPCGLIGYHDIGDIHAYLDTLNPSRLEKYYMNPPYSNFGLQATIGIAIYYMS